MQSTSKLPPTGLSTPAVSRLPERPNSASAGNLSPFVSPFDVVQQVKRYGDANRLKEAIEVVKGSSLRSQNIVVWNTLIDYALKARRPKLAYELYIDMKRRGLKPLPTTWAVLFRGFAEFASQSPLSKSAIENVYSAYANFSAYIAEKRDTDPAAIERCIIPLNAYLNFLAHGGLYKQLFGTYYTMDDTGPLAPDERTYTCILQGILDRKQGIMKGEEEGALEARNASLGRRVWKQMMDRIEDGTVNFTVDAHLLSAMLSLLTSSPRGPDHLFGLSLISTHLGLAQPTGAPSPPPRPLPAHSAKPQSLSRPVSSSPPALNGHSLHMALTLAARMRKFRLVLQYLQQIMDSPSKHLLHVGHMHVAFTAYGGLARTGADEVGQAMETLEWMLRQKTVPPSEWQKLRPTQETYSLMFMVCWRGVEYRAARRVFGLMTGYSPEDFDQSGKPREPQSAEEDWLRLDARAASCLLRCAMASKSPVNIAHALRIIQHFGLDHLLGPAVTSHSRIREVARAAGPSRRAMRVDSFYRAKLAEALIELLDARADMPYSPAFREELEKRARAALTEFHRVWKWKGKIERVRAALTELHGVWNGKSDGAANWSGESLVDGEADIPAVDAAARI